MRSVTLPLLIGLVLGSAVAAQRLETPREPLQLQKTTVGSELYRYYCSNCHGLDAKGRPATTATRTAAPDLTALAANNGGRFPKDSLRTLIAKGPQRDSAHGTTDMPVWGAIFKAFDRNDTLVDVRIENLVNYLESLQTVGGKRPAQ